MIPSIKINPKKIGKPYKTGVLLFRELCGKEKSGQKYPKILFDQYKSDLYLSRIFENIRLPNVDKTLMVFKLVVAVHMKRIDVLK